MMQKAIEVLQHGAGEGINTVNDTINDAISIDPESELEYEASQEAESEVDAENSKIDEINAKIDDDVNKTREKVNTINNSFDNGVNSAKEKIKEAGKSDIAIAYRCARLVYWGNLARNYIAEHPDWANSVRDKMSEIGQGAVSKFQQLGIDGYADSATKQICEARDAMYGTPDAGIETATMPDTNMILQGATAPVIEAGIQMAM